MKGTISKRKIAAIYILAIFLYSSCMAIESNENSTGDKIINENPEVTQTMEVVAQENWSWMLYHAPNSYYLSVVCGSVGIYTRDIELTKEEILEFKEKGIPYINSLALKIRKTPHLFKERHLPSFTQMESVKEAAQKWRKAKKVAADI